MKIIFLFLFTVSAFAVTGSCLTEINSIRNCITYEVGDAQTLDQVKDSCEAFSQSKWTDVCPKANSCLIEGEHMTTQVFYYYISLEMLEQVCDTAGGKVIPE